MAAERVANKQLLRGFQYRCASRKLRVLFSAWRQMADSAAAAQLAAADFAAALQRIQLQAILQEWYNIAARKRLLRQAVLGFQHLHAVAVMRSCLLAWHAVAADRARLLLEMATKTQRCLQAAVLQVILRNTGFPV